VPWAEVAARVPQLLQQIQADMLEGARQRYSSSLEKVTSWDDFMAALNNKHMVLAPWADEIEVSMGGDAKSVSHGLYLGV
jgi:prolyl-tRNA synthetase